MLILLGIYTALPFVAPTLMKLGATGPARVIYTLYSPFCHQFAFRSFFLWGEQGFYPRSIVPSDLTPFETYVGNSPEFQEALSRYLPPGTPITGDAIFTYSPALQFAAREFVGNP